jgi:CheY-like chemotaxis protein
VTTGQRFTSEHPLCAIGLPISFLKPIASATGTFTLFFNSGYFTFAKSDPPPPGPDEELSPFPKHRKRLKIIVVDDEPVIADTLVDILKGEGCDAVAVSSGQSAIKWARLIQPDVVISDVAMPGMTGIEAARAIREFLPLCRIILFSGQASTVDLLDIARAEGHEFELLSKPIKPNVLLSTLGLTKPN